MKNTTLIIIAFILSAGSLMAQIPNGGFEDWTSMGTYNNPDMWENTNIKSIAFNKQTCQKGTPGNVGTAYMKLTSRAVTGGVIPGVAVCGVLDTANYMPVKGFPYTGRPKSMTGKWQHMSFGANDMGFMEVILTKWNDTLNKRDTVAFVHKNLGNMVMSWGSFTATLTYFSTDVPDSAIVFLSSSNKYGTNAADASYLYVDALTFTGFATGINNKSENDGKIKVYPNPVTDNKLYINTDNTTKLTVSVVNSIGQVIYQNAAYNEQFINFEYYTKGMYTVILTDEEKGTVIHKLSVQ